MEKSRKVTVMAVLAAFLALAMVACGEDVERTGNNSSSAVNPADTNPDDLIGPDEDPDPANPDDTTLPVEVDHARIASYARWHWVKVNENLGRGGGNNFGVHCLNPETGNVAFCADSESFTPEVERNAANTDPNVSYYRQGTMKLAFFPNEEQVAGFTIVFGDGENWDYADFRYQEGTDVAQARFQRSGDEWRKGIVRYLLDDDKQSEDYDREAMKTATKEMAEREKVMGILPSPRRGYSNLAP